MPAFCIYLVFTGVFGNGFVLYDSKEYLLADGLQAAGFGQWAVMPNPNDAMCYLGIFEKYLRFTIYSRLL